MPVTCCWPGCDREAFKVEMPLCMSHRQDAWDDVQDWMERTKINHATAARQERKLKREREIQAQREAHGNQPGWIYYIRVGELVKVGYSTDVPKRMRQYPPDSVLLAVHPGTPGLEVQLHRDFTASRARGREWYWPDTQINEHVTKVLDQFGSPNLFAVHVRSTQVGPTPKSWRAPRSA